MNYKLNSEQDWQELARQANWRVTRLSKLCNISTRTLEMYFHKHFSIAPKIWLAKQRQQQAVELLRDGSTVKETAAQLGFKHPQHLSREFKKHSGFPPVHVQSKPLFRKMV